MIKKLLSLAGYLVIAILIILIILSTFLIIKSKNDSHEIPSIFGYKSMTVLSGSMRPVLKEGDLIIDRHINPEDINVGDIITYRLNNEVLVTHRVFEIIKGEGELRFKTKGDANKVEDYKMVSSHQLVGKLAFIIPYGGYISKFAATEEGFVVFIVIPLFLLIGGELKSILSDTDSKINQNNSE